MSDDKSDLVSNIVSENNNSEGSVEKKALNRMVAEGYKYHVLTENGESGILDPIEDADSKANRRRWNKVKLVLFLGVIMITCLVVVIIFQHFKAKQYADKGKICMSTTCVKGSAYILNKMDTETDPCEDFYEFSCGNWLKNVKIPPSKTKYGAFSQISDEIDLIMREILEGKDILSKAKNSTAIHKAKLYYDLCMDETAIDAVKSKPVIKLITNLGSWGFTVDPEVGPLDTSVWNLQDAILLSHRLDFSPLFNMGLSTDERNSSKYMIKFEQSGLTLSNPKEYFTNHTNSEALKKAYLEYLSKFVSLLGADKNLETEFNDLYEFEHELAKIHVPKEQLRDPLKIYHKMTLKEFQDDYLGDVIDINNYMKGTFGDLATIKMDTEVIVYTPEYFLKLQELVKTTDKKTLANYVVWIAVQRMGGYLNANFTDAAMILEKVETGLKELPPRWKRCLGKASSLGFALGSLYVEKHFKEKSKKEVEMLLEEVRSAFIANLDDLEWMDDKTREYAVEKAKNVSKMLGYPDYITDPVKLDKHYENLTLDKDSFFDCKLYIKEFYRQKNLRRFGTVPDRLEWGMYPTVVNGYYSADFNHIVFPAGILRPPLFNIDSPKSFNFGSFGMICGHELTHGFDDKGREFDKEGNMRDWWTQSSADNFIQHTKCFEDFYHNYTVNGTHLNGKTTLSENIADNGGMKMAYLAYQKWLHKTGSDSLVLPGIDFNSDQLFFIGMAQVWCSYYTPEYQQQAILTDPHSIAKFRVLGSMSNSADFAKVFNCSKNSAMNPEKKCTVW